MPLASYSDLVDAISAWLNKGTALAARIPDFIRLTESRLNKVLDDPAMEVRATSTVAGRYLTLPDDFGSLRSISVGGVRLKGATQGDFSGFSPQSGDPLTYGIAGNQLEFAPVPGSGSVEIVYSRSIPALSEDRTTNWLLDRSPDAYLYGSLLHAEFFGWNDERLPTIKAFYDDAVDALQQDAAKRRWGAAPLAPRLGRT